MITVDYLGLEKKSGRIFCVRQVYLTKSCHQIWVRVNQPFIPFIKHHIWGETVPWGTVFIIHTSDRMQYFTILQYKVRSFNIQVDRRILAKPLKKSFQNHICMASRFSLLKIELWSYLNEHYRFNIIKNLLRLFFI